MESNQIERVTIVGGGDAGLMSALIVDKLCENISVSIIDDFDESLPQVGKSTTNYILNTLHNVLDIDRHRFFSKVRPIWKASVFFENWCGCDPFHVPFDDQLIQPESGKEETFDELQYRHNNRNFRTIGVEIVEQGVSPVTVKNGRVSAYPHVAYHLSVDSLNLFLRELCTERGIELIDDRIVDASVTGKRVDHVRSDSKEYTSDLYIDASGFNRVLISKLESQFKGFDLPLDSAVVTKVDVNLKDIVPATVINSADHGWIWQIDTFDWRDVGYVYSSSHVSESDAIVEMENRVSEDIRADNISSYKFDPGYHSQAWIGNCIAIGNALGFVEPLQSTALTTNAILTEKLAMLISEHHRLNHPGIREIYNRYIQSMWENIYDFISIHYRYSSGSTDFWQECQHINKKARLSQYIDNYQRNGFNSYKDFNQWQFTNETHFYRVFNQWHFYRVLRNLGVKSKFYNDVETTYSDTVKRKVVNQEDEFRQNVSNHLSHESFYENYVN